MSGKVDLSGQEIPHFIASKNYDERITAVHMCKVYEDVFSRERESNQQQVQKNKRIKRILLLDDEYVVNFVMKSFRFIRISFFIAYKN